MNIISATVLKECFLWKMIIIAFINQKKKAQRKHQNERSLIWKYTFTKA